MAKGQVLLTSRVRLARNLEGYPFPSKISPDQAQALTQEVIDAFDKREDHWRLYRLADLSPIDAFYQAEANHISPDLVKRGEGASFLRKEDGDTTVMILEEDHLRIQALRKGMALKDLYQDLRDLTLDLEESLTFSFDHKLGYLTACPTNLGTGIRASCMLHLPALDHFGLEGVNRSINQMGFVLRGMHGEGSQGLGNIYQLSNERTLGLNEEDFIRRAMSITQEIIELEENKREDFYLDQMIDLEDLARRSYGILSQARVMDYEEAMTHLSRVQLGIDLGVLRSKGDLSLYDLMVNLGQAHLQLDRGSYLDDKSCQIFRANKTRKLMKEVL